MAILAQVGYARAEYVESGLKDGVIAGAVLCPRYDEPGVNRSWSKGLRDLTKPAPFVIFDPQFYVTAIHADRIGKLQGYPYYASSLTRSSFSSQNVASYVKKVIDFQESLAVSRYVSPTILIQDFRDPWSQIAVSLAQEAITYHEKAKLKPGLLVSLVVDEAALRNRVALNEYLDTITGFEAKGFYVVVRRTDPLYPGLYDEQSLAGLTYLTHVLARVNGYEVVHGYADTHAPVLSVAGALHNCTGWFSTQRQFSFKPFEPAPKGGRPARERYMSGPLMNTILVNPELNAIYLAKKLGEVLTGTPYDGVMSSGPSGAAWPLRTSTLHHWATLSRLSTQVTAPRDLKTSLSTIEKLIQQSLATYSDLGTAGVRFDTANSRRDPDLWQRVVTTFRTDVGL